MQISLSILKMSFIAYFSFLWSQDPIKFHKLLLVVSLSVFRDTEMWVYAHNSAIRCLVYHDKYVNESDGSLVEAKNVPGIAKDITCM